MNNIMLDLETMGTDPDAAIIAIGAVRFDEHAVTDDFYEIVDLQSSVDIGLKINPKTVMWWMKQSNEARSQFERPARHISYALGQFSIWIGKDARVWGNGAAFDNVILANAYRLVGIEQPWKFWNDRCYRTIKSMHRDVKFERKGTYHCAVDDAQSQADHLIKIWESLRGE